MTLSFTTPYPLYKDSTGTTRCYMKHSPLERNKDNCLYQGLGLCHFHTLKNYGFVAFAGARRMPGNMKVLKTEHGRLCGAAWGDRPFSVNVFH